jgi:hypothetical protein
MTSAAPVTNNAWHHVVLSAAGTTQTLYLDGVYVGSITTSSALVQHRGADLGYIGIGKLTRGWPGGPLPPGATSASPARSTRSPSTGHPLANTQVSAHYAARTASTRLTSIVEPGPITATSIVYNDATGRIKT